MHEINLVYCYEKGKGISEFYCTLYDTENVGSSPVIALLLHLQNLKATKSAYDVYMGI
jgi:hypothetical protein